jgi:RimJ/RimL family protein N-acetyltransferase
MRQIVASTPQELEVLSDNLRMISTPNLRGVTLLVDGEPVIVVGYDGWTAGSAMMHLWIKHPQYVGRDIIREVFKFPFDQADLRVVMAQVESRNERSLSLCRRLGFTTAAVIRDGYGPGNDMHVLELHRDNFRYLDP